MAEAQPLALDQVFARGRDVEQQVDEVILEKVHFVDVEEAPMRPRQQAGLEYLDAAGQRLLEIERADDAILRHAERQVDDRHRHRLGLEPANTSTPPIVGSTEAQSSASFISS